MDGAMPWSMPRLERVPMQRAASVQARPFRGTIDGGTPAFRPWWVVLSCEDEATPYKR
jgi:hypothetical protein